LKVTQEEADRKLASQEDIEKIIRHKGLISTPGMDMLTYGILN
jgi:hypothetical protein